MPMNKNPLTAFLLSFIPGLGHGYLGRPVRLFVYGTGFFGPILLFAFLGFTNNLSDTVVLFLLFIAGMAAFINMIDMVVTLITGKYPGGSTYQGGAAHYEAYRGGEAAPGAGAASTPFLSIQQQQEKTRTIALSIIPGLGHMSLGLMQRGITLLIAFVGLFAIIVFLASIIGSGAILVFLLALPVIWVYSMFDVVGLLHAKHRGEDLSDKSVFEDLEGHIESGVKSKVLAIALAIFPGAGHLYLGLQKRGLQLMGGFLLSIYIMDTMRLTLFLFLLPLFWCFAFFDALQQTSRYERNTMSDDPILKQFVPYQRWFGIALLGFGIYYLLERVISQYASNFPAEVYHQYLQIKYMIPTAITSFIMITIGLRLVFGSKSKRDAQQNVRPIEHSNKEDAK